MSKQRQTTTPPLRMVVGSPPRTLDPPNATDNAAQEIIRHVYEGLVSRDNEGAIVPSLAEAWEIFDEGRTYIFHIRPGVWFHDGSLLDAEAVTANLRRLGGEKTRRSHLLVPIMKRVAVVDSNTVQVSLHKPFAPFLAILTSGALRVVSPQALAEHEARYSRQEGEFDDSVQSERDRTGLGRQPVGTGPFSLVEWDDEDRLVLQRHEQYWGQTPSLERAELECLSSGQTRSEALLEGRADAALRLPLDAMQRLHNEPDIQILTIPSDNWLFIGMNHLHKPFDDVRVRRALNLAVNQEAIIQHVLGGLGRPVDSCISRSSFGYAPTYTYPYDPAQAKQLLVEAGLDNGFSTELATPRGAYPMDYETALAVAEHLAQIDVSLKVIPFDNWGEYLTYVRQPPERATHQMFLLIRGEGDTGDAHFTLFTKFHSQGWYHSNNQFYCNPEVDKLSELGAFTIHPQQRLQAYAKAQNLIMQDAPMIFLHTVTETLAYRSNVAGIELYPSGMYDLSQVKMNG